MSRRPKAELQFGSDSFLDVVANIVGILIILIVIAGLHVSKIPVVYLPPGTPLSDEPLSGPIDYASAKQMGSVDAGNSEQQLQELVASQEPEEEPEPEAEPQGRSGQSTASICSTLSVWSHFQGWTN